MHIYSDNIQEVFLYKLDAFISRHLITEIRISRIYERQL